MLINITFYSHINSTLTNLSQERVFTINLMNLYVMYKINKHIVKL